MITAFAIFSATTLSVAAPVQGAPAGNGMFALIVPYAAIFALFYFLFIRPQQKQRKALEERIRQVRRGDEIVSAGGVIGEVVHIKENTKDGAAVPTMEDRITIKSADARIIIERRAITRVLSPSSSGRKAEVSVLGIRVLGSPILRQSTIPVSSFNNELQRLIDDMIETMYRAKGIGLAAPQVGRTERLAVVDVDDGKGPFVIINPEITVSEGKVKGEEGCLSIPDLYGDVERAARVTVRALNREGRPFEVTAEELLSRCLQHEIDHLDGRLFIDHLSLLKRRSLLSKWEEKKNKYPDLVRDVASEPEEREPEAL